MGLIRKQIIFILVVSFFIGCLSTLQYSDYPQPARCESDRDCLRGKAKCLRRECHCTNELHIGDGKRSCEKNEKCEEKELENVCKKFRNSVCVRIPDESPGFMGEVAIEYTCRCKSGYFGMAKKGSQCLNPRSRNPSIAPCVNDKNCPTYSKCGRHNWCECRDELQGNGEKCKPGYHIEKPCRSKSQCNPNAHCHNRKCQCQATFVGNGKFCRKATNCLRRKNCKEFGSIDHLECKIDPFFPNKPICQCQFGFYTMKIKGKKKCAECVSDNDCKHKTDAICIKETGKCGCKDGLVLGTGITALQCEAGPQHKCKKDSDCHPKAKCENGECICQGKMVGNGKFCTKSAACPSGYDCGISGTCLKDPRLTKGKPFCKCGKGYVLTAEGKCAECVKDRDCPSQAKCKKTICECKDELIKDGKTCKPGTVHQCTEDHDCNDDAKCIMGKCYCGAKKIGNGKVCRASLPCPSNHKCGSDMECVVDPLFPEKPICRCHEGTIQLSPNGTCEEVTKCVKNNLICPSDKICGRLEDGRSGCICHEGYEVREGNDRCQDIDECSDKRPCSEHSKCKNTEGSYKCQCDQGYVNSEKNKDICRDLDECFELANPCEHEGQVCDNVEGTFICLCKTGYVRVKADNPADHRCAKPGSSTEEEEEDKEDEGSGDCNCEQGEECVDGECQCMEGYVWHPEREECVDQLYSATKPNALLYFGAGQSLHAIGRFAAVILGLLGGLAFTL